MQDVGPLRMHLALRQRAEGALSASLLEMATGDSGVQHDGIPCTAVVPVCLTWSDARP